MTSPDQRDPVARDGSDPLTADIVARLARYEPAALHSQAPVVWARAVGTRVIDHTGREWLDWTSGVLAANAGHSPPQVTEAIAAQAKSGLLHAYAFPTAIRAEALAALSTLTGYDHVLFFTTGAEAVEGAVKLSRSRAQRCDQRRAAVVSFEGAFHGRTMGAQLAGGLDAQRHWVPEVHEFVRVPYPSAGWRVDDLIAALAAVGLASHDLACVIIEPYQGSTLRVLPISAAVALRDWCAHYNVPLIFDEIQSGFGRTGRLFGFEHFGIRPDMVLCGKGISSGLPASAVLYRDSVLADGLCPGEMNSTHAFNPVVLAAVCATLSLFQDGTLVKQAARAGHAFSKGIEKMASRYPRRLSSPRAWGMVGGITVIDRDGNPDGHQAQIIAERAVAGGLLLFAPIGEYHALLKFAPPLIMTEDELTEGFTVLDRAIAEVSA